MEILPYLIAVYVFAEVVYKRLYCWKKCCK
jgi:hypothetical protein